MLLLPHDAMSTLCPCVHSAAVQVFRYSDPDTHVLTLRATDFDTEAHNRDVSYVLEEGDNEGAVVLDGSSGELRVAEGLRKAKTRPGVVRDRHRPRVATAAGQGERHTARAQYIRYTRDQFELFWAGRQEFGDTIPDFVVVSLVETSPRETNKGRQFNVIWTCIAVQWNIRERILFGARELNKKSVPFSFWFHRT